MEALYLAYARLVENVGSDYLRYLYHQIDWNERLIGIKGARGVGKTTMLLQHIKLAFPDRQQAFYVSLDHLWFAGHTLSELVEHLYTHGVTHLFLDEVHRYPNWLQEIKNLYDSYPRLYIVFTGSSLLHMDNAQADLSRRVRMYTLRGLSFREYLKINQIADVEVCHLSEILGNHLQISSSIAGKIKVLPHFERYMLQGYYPFHLETTSSESYFSRVENMVNTVIENDLPAVVSMNYETLTKTKRLLVQLSQIAPFTLNVSTLCDVVATTRNQLIKLLSLLDRAALIRLLYASNKGMRALGKPEKVLFDNPNLLAALVRHVDKGTLRESFLAAMMSVRHEVQYPLQGDLLVDGKYLFEIGGRGKGFGRIRNIPDSYVAADEMETGFGNKIPLWLFGLLY